MRKILSASVFVATAISAPLVNHANLEQGASFVCNVTINSYLPTVQWSAGDNSYSAPKLPMLISLLGPETWVYATNCTNNVPGALSSLCSDEPVGVNPAFNISTMASATPPQNYTGMISGGGF